MIPLKYNLRNLRVRGATTLATVLCIAAVVAISCVLFGFIDGLRYNLRVSGDKLDLIVLRNGSTAETNSGFTAATADEAKLLPGVARDPEGALLAAGEVVVIPVMSRRDGTRANVIFRGVERASRKLRPDFTIVEGRDFEPGKGECIVSQSMSRRFEGAGLNERLVVGPKEEYRVVGLFTAGGSSAESEIWTDVDDLRRNSGREGFVSSLQLRANSAADKQALVAAIKGNQQFKLDPKDEAAYFQEQSASGTLLKVAAFFLSIFLSLGAMFIIANIMFSAVKSRAREVGTLRALGFPASNLLFCFLLESILICGLGGALGLLAALPFSGATFNTINFGTFSELSISFRFGAWVIIGSLLMTALMGVIGGLLPAVRAVRMNVIDALRQI